MVLISICCSKHEFRTWQEEGRQERADLLEVPGCPEISLLLLVMIMFLLI